METKKEIKNENVSMMKILCEEVLLGMGIMKEIIENSETDFTIEIDENFKEALTEKNLVRLLRDCSLFGNGFYVPFTITSKKDTISYRDVSFFYENEIGIIYDKINSVIKREFCNKLLQDILLEVPKEPNTNGLPPSMRRNASTFNNIQIPDYVYEQFLSPEERNYYRNHPFYRADDNKILIDIRPVLHRKANNLNEFLNYLFDVKLKLSGKEGNNKIGPLAFNKENANNPDYHSNFRKLSKNIENCLRNIIDVQQQVTNFNILYNTNVGKSKKLNTLDSGSLQKYLFEFESKFNAAEKKEESNKNTSLGKDFVTFSTDSHFYETVVRPSISNTVRGSYPTAITSSVQINNTEENAERNEESVQTNSAAGVPIEPRQEFLEIRLPNVIIFDRFNPLSVQLSRLKSFLITRITAIYLEATNEEKEFAGLVPSLTRGELTSWLNDRSTAQILLIYAAFLNYRLYPEFMTMDPRFRQWVTHSIPPTNIEDILQLFLLRYGLVTSDAIHTFITTRFLRQVRRHYETVQQSIDLQLTSMSAIRLFQHSF